MMKTYKNLFTEIKRVNYLITSLLNLCKNLSKILLKARTYVSLLAYFFTLGKDFFQKAYCTKNQVHEILSNYY